MEAARGLRGWRRLAIGGAAVTYLLVALGGIVRITGSGMGCGDDWPLCNGALVPPMDLPTFIEYSHRLVAAAVAVLVVALGVLAWRSRPDASWQPRRRIAAWAVVLLVVQILLGAITVWLELPPSLVVLHLGTGMALLGVLVGASCQGVAPQRLGGRSSDGAARLAWGATVLGVVVVLAGALVANLGAAPACQGFPLCNGELLPGRDWRIELHWFHRMLAYVFALGTISLPILAARRRSWDGAARASAWVVVVAAFGQVAVAAAMVWALLPDGLRALHVALGAAVFAALVAHAWVVDYPAPQRA
jgi:heme A synthase